MKKYLISLILSVLCVSSCFAYRVQITEKSILPFGMFHYYIYNYHNVKSWNITDNSFTLTTYDNKTFSKTFSGLMGLDHIDHYNIYPENDKEKQNNGPSN